MRLSIGIAILTLPIAASAAEYGSLAIAPIVVATAPTAAPTQTSGQISGWIDGIYIDKHSTLTLRRRDGSMAIIDISKAEKSPDFPAIGIEAAITAIGTTDKAGILHALAIFPAKPSPNLWPTDQ